MNKTSNNNQIALDKTPITCYNTSMTNDNNNTKTQFLKGTNNMTNLTHEVRVIKHIDGSYNTFANFPTVKDAVDYMRNWNPSGYAADSWYIINADGIRLRMNPQGKLQVFNSLIG
jgi:putative lipase involved disintegration of autophagic bodies